jgi:Flp pilus assembly pilin Flp
MDVVAPARTGREVGALAPGLRKSSRWSAARPIHRTVNNLEPIFGRFATALRPRDLASRQEGQALIEYALIVSLIAIVAIASLKLTGTNISKILNTISGEV